MLLTFKKKEWTLLQTHLSLLHMYSLHLHRNASLVSKTTDTDLHAQTASKDEPIQGNDTHAEAAMSDLQGNNSLSLHVGDGHTSPHRLKEEFRCSEGESKEPKPSHLDKFGSGDGRGEDRNSGFRAATLFFNCERQGPVQAL